MIITVIDDHNRIGRWQHWKPTDFRESEAYKIITNPDLLAVNQDPLGIQVPSFETQQKDWLLIFFPRVSVWRTVVGKCFKCSSTMSRRRKNVESRLETGEIWPLPLQPRFNRRAHLSPNLLSLFKLLAGHLHIFFNPFKPSGQWNIQCIRCIGLYNVDRCGLDL